MNPSPHPILLWFVFLALLLVGRLIWAAPPSAEFLDELILKDTKNGRDFVVQAPFRYKDPNGVTWVVPVGQIVNGASIPQPLWSLLGGPWEGKYRRASVIHDYFFEEKRYDSASVHRVFYDAMLTDGVSLIKAKLFYWAVVRFNDEWKASGSPLPSCGEEFTKAHHDTRCVILPLDEYIPELTYKRISVKFDEREFREAEGRMQEEVWTPEQIAADALAKRQQAQEIK